MSVLSTSRVVLGLAALTALAPAALALPSATETSISGSWQVVASESRPGWQLPHDRTLLVDDAGRGWDVTLPPGAEPKAGDRVRVRGHARGRQLTASSAVVTPAAPVVSAAPRSRESTSTVAAPAVAEATPDITLATGAVSTQRVLMILASWAAPDALTQAQAQQMLSANDGWFRENSYGALGVSGDVTPWLTIAGPDGGLCWMNMGQYMTQAKAAALAAGFDPARYDRTMLYFPQQGTGTDCAGYAGWAFQPGSDVWLNGTMDLRTTTHEQGHNLGLAHAHLYRCTDATGATVTLSSACSVDEYGDPASAMGGSNYVGHLSAPAKQQLGWLSGRVADLSTGGQAVLAPIEGTSGVAAGTFRAGTRQYWMERRAAAGADAGLPAGLVGGVLLRVVDAALASGAGLLDASPGTDSLDSRLAPGQSWISPEGLVIRVGTPSATGELPVSVGAAAEPATPAQVSGSVKGTTLTVSWQPPAFDGGSPVTGYAVELSSGEVRALDASARSASFSRLADGTYTVAVRARNAVGVGAAGAATALIGKVSRGR